MEKTQPITHDSLKNCIQHRRKLKPNKINTNRQDAHFALAFDSKYAIGAGVCITSIIKNNTNTNCIFHLFYSEIDRTDIIKIQKLSENEHTEINLYKIENIFSSFPTFSHFSHAIYYRLIIANELAPICDKVLYVDADMVCINTLDHLFTIDTKDIVIAAVPDADSVCAKKKNNFNLSKNYFNSGLMLIDTQNWEKNNISAKAFYLIIKNHDTFEYPDQDALNIAADRLILFIDKKWNHLFRINSDIGLPPRETAIIHYVGSFKPWLRNYPHPATEYFNKYKKCSPWADTKAPEACHYKEIHQNSTIARRNKMHVKSIYLYIKYITKKISHLIKQWRAQNNER